MWETGSRYPSVSSFEPVLTSQQVHTTDQHLEVMEQKRSVDWVQQKTTDDLQVEVEHLKSKLPMEGRRAAAEAALNSKLHFENAASVHL